MELKIYGLPLSVHTRKAIVAARLKAIPHEIVPLVPVVPDSLPSNWREISPTGLIPAIDDNGFVLADSTAIVHYFERKHPEPALFPADDEQFAMALFLDAWAGRALFRNVVNPVFFNRIVNPNINRQPSDQDALDQALTVAAPEAFGYLESRNPGEFLVGDALSISDLAIVSNLIMLHYLGARIEAGRYPQLARYFDLRIRTPLLAAVLADEAPYADNMGLDRSFIA